MFWDRNHEVGKKYVFNTDGIVLLKWEFTFKHTVRQRFIWSLYDDVQTWSERGTRNTGPSFWNLGLAFTADTTNAHAKNNSGVTGQSVNTKTHFEVRQLPVGRRITSWHSYSSVKKGIWTPCLPRAHDHRLTACLYCGRRSGRGTTRFWSPAQGDLQL